MEELLAQLPTLLLVSSRVAGVTTASPVFSNRFLLPQVRVALTLLLGVILLPTVTRITPDTNSATLLVQVVLELLVGLLIGFMTVLVFAAVQMGGALLDMDMGFALSQVLDPVTQRVEPLMGSFFQTLAMMLYLAVDGHHWLLRSLAASYELVPPGSLTFAAQGPLYVVNLFGSFLGLAVQMVLPFVAVLLLTTMALAGLSRAVPQVQIFGAGIGVKALVGFILLWLMLPFFLSFMESLYHYGNDQLLHVLPQLR